MKKIGLIVAMDKEFGLLRGLMSGGRDVSCQGLECFEGKIGGKDVVLARSGIGKVCAAAGALELIKNFAPDCIINTGVAGGIDVKTRVMDIVAGESVVYHDVWCGKPNLYGQVQGFPLFYASDAKFEPFLEKNIKKGLIVSGDKFISSPEGQADILKHFPDALAVDMESAAVAQTCYVYHTPCLILRLISDTPGVEHHQKQYDRFWETAAEKSFANLKEILFKLSDATTTGD